MNGWNPIAEDITDSSVWRMSDQIRLAWVTIIAKKDYRTQLIRMNAWKLAQWARIPQEVAEEAIRVFCAPDPNSGCPLEEGRRLKPIEGEAGTYLVVTGREYAKRMGAQRNRENTREKMAEARAAKREALLNGENHVSAEVPPVSPEQQHYQNQARIVLAKMVEITGIPFRDTPAHLDPIAARLAQPEITREGCELMIRRKAKEWKGTKMNDLLRPETLFGNKFDSYYDQRNAPVTTLTPSGNPPRPKYNQPNI